MAAPPPSNLNSALVGAYGAQILIFIKLLVLKSAGVGIVPKPKQKSDTPSLENFPTKSLPLTASLLGLATGPS